MPRKGTTTEKGYGSSHQRLRARWTPKVKAGLVDCARCHQPINPDQPWQLGHTDDRTGYQGPEHTHCNLSAGGRKGAAITNQGRATLKHSRAW